MIKTKETEGPLPRETPVHTHFLALYGASVKNARRRYVARLGQHVITCKKDIWGTRADILRQPQDINLAASGHDPFPQIFPTGSNDARLSSMD